jgi:urease subunit beta
MIPGEVSCPPGTVEVNPGRDTQTLRVVNTGDRPIQVGSHFHLAAVNPALEFDRRAAWGWRLDIPAGTAVRFEPGIERDVSLVPIAGARIVPGLRAEWAGTLDAGLPPALAETGGPADAD